MCHRYASYMFFISYTYLIILSHFMYSINLIYLFNRKVANRNKQTNKQTMPIYKLNKHIVVASLFFNVRPVRP